MSQPLDKKQTLERLSFVKDEPDFDSEQFQFKKFATQLANVILDQNTPTPYVIGVHGEWGSGKTSLIGQVHSIVENKITNKDKVIWFNAWEYERLDPVAALLQIISTKYERNRGFKKAIKGLVYLASDLALRSQIGMSLEEVKKHFDSSVEEIPTITQELGKMIGDGRLIVFVDDLDRCLVENSLHILECVKLFLNAKGVIFVIAVDMTKLERAWALRYNNKETAIEEGRDHVDKIFQLKLGLPPKDAKEVEEYVKKLAETLPDRIRKLVVDGCPHNPRKIKRVLNLIYFIASQIEDESFDRLFPLVVIWAIATSTYPKLARIIEGEPYSFVQMGLVVNDSANFDVLKRYEQRFVDVASGRSSLTMKEGSINWTDVFRPTLDGLNYVIKNNDVEAFDFLKVTGNYFNLKFVRRNGTDEEIKNQLQTFYASIGDLLSVVIYKTGLLG